MFAYIVRCNFSDPTKEKAWNDWYSGPKLGQMLAKPYFRATQRFRRSDGMGRNYLALWIVETPEAFKTPEYTSDWGFFEWRPYIIDWSRDLFTGPNLTDHRFAVSPQGALHVVSFDGMSKQDAMKAKTIFASIHPKLAWLTISGLDKHTEIIGLQTFDERPRSWQQSNAPAGGEQETIYLPISDFHLASSYRKVD